MTRKLLAVLLSLIFICMTIPFAYAESITPVVMVTGFGATTLAINGEQVFPPSGDQILSALGLDDLSPQHIKSELEKWTAEKGYVAQLSAIVSRILEPIKMNPDGTSYYDVQPIVSGAANTSLAAFTENDILSLVPYTGSEFLDMESIGDRVGDENVFNFTYDWRLDYNETADLLKEYIDDVLDVTGADKVSIYSISQGSMVVGQYLWKYGNLGQCDNVVFDTPVLGGTTFVTDVFNTQRYLTVDLKTVLKLLADILHTETDLTFIADIVDNFPIVKDALDYGRTNVVLPPMKTCIAAWEMLPIDKFDEISALWLDSENSAVISTIKEFYSGFMSHITDTFELAEKYGTTVSIKACTGTNLVLTSDTYSDGIVDMKYSCGAICAPWGETFPESYKQAVDNGKNCISPDRTIDISAGYWPQRTWIFNGLLHGQVEWCRKSLALVETLLYTHDLKDAYSSYEFPQFMESTAPTSDISISFKNTNSSFLATDIPGEYILTVKNLSLEKCIIISGIESDVISIDFKSPKALLSGEELQIPVAINSVTSGNLKVKYRITSKIFTEAEKTFGITVLDNYTGATVENTTAENDNTPFIIRWILSFIKNLFTK